MHIKKQSHKRCIAAIGRLFDVQRIAKTGIHTDQWNRQVLDFNTYNDVNTYANVSYILYSICIYVSMCVYIYNIIIISSSSSNSSSSINIISL